MKNTVKDYLYKLKVNKLKQRKTAAFLLVLSVFVATGVLWQLRLTGITLAGEAYCGLEEHTHTEDCIERRLICGYTEDEPAREEDTQPEAEEASEDEQASGDELAPAATEETQTHIHTDECYEIAYICGKEEHIHTLDCYPDSAADVECAEDWESTLPVGLSGDAAQDLILVAKSQLGYTESENNYKVDESGIKHGYTRYGQWYGSPYGDWNAMFAAFCLNYAGIVPNEAMPVASGCAAWVVQLKNEGLYLAVADMEENTLGNLLFLAEQQDEVPDRVGIVIYASEETITVIEGDLGDSVAVAEYSKADGRICGYGFLPTQMQETQPDSASNAATGETDEANNADLAESTLAAEAYCGLEEHTHTEACIERRLICSYTEDTAADATQTHIHTDECYEIIFICGKEEHIHTLDCCCDPAADVECAEDWESTLPEELSGDAAQDLMAIAESQLGYTESEKNYKVDESGIKHGYTRYGQWYGDPYGDWNTMFAAFCLNYAGIIPNEAMPVAADCAAWVELLENEGLYLPVADMEEYMVGNLLFLAEQQDNVPDRVGIVIFANEETVTVIEGDLGDNVAVAEYSIEDERICGYGFIPFDYFSMAAIAYTEGSVPEGGGGSTDLSLPHSKTIDAFRDGTDNPDTDLDNIATDTTDLYRLYLDVSGNDPINVLFVFDFSGSMNTTDPNYTMDGQTRYSVMLDALANINEDTIIDEICQNPENMVSFTTFSSYQEGYRAETSGSWTNDADTFKDELTAAKTPTWATNYERGLELAKSQLAALFAAHPERQSYKTHLIFVGDGAATEYLADPDSNGGYDHLPQEYEYYYSSSRFPYFYVNGEAWTTNTNHRIPIGYTEVKAREETAAVINFVFPHTSRYITQFQAEYPNLIIDTIAFSSVDMDAYIDGTAYQYSSLLKQMPQNGGAYYKAGNGTDLASLMDSILALRSMELVISDTLSAYVELHSQPDFKVTMTNNSTKEVTTLYENGAKTLAGDGILQKIVVDGKTIKAVFEPDYELTSTYTITLSFNVQTTETAYQQYMESGYAAMGDIGTDYGTNATSSEQAGFYSNAQAGILYYRGGQYWEEAYDMPVVQVEECSLVLYKESTDGKPLTGAEFELYRLDSNGEQIKTKESPYTITAENGRLRIDGLVRGEYLLVETKAPNGYYALPSSVSFTLTQSEAKTESQVVVGGAGEIDGETLPMLTIPNQSGGRFPDSGGSGSLPYTIGGMLIMAVPLLVGCRRRRRQRGGVQ